MEYMQFMAEDWIDTYPLLWRWKWFSHELPQKIESCIQRYRYTGTFVGYVYKTLEYSAMTLPKPKLLDDTKLHGAVRKLMASFMILKRVKIELRIQCVFSATAA